MLLTGISPERALTRLVRQNIPVYHAKKQAPTSLSFFVKKRDVSKVFVLYPDAKSLRGGGAYTVRALPAQGGLKWLRALTNRLGVLMGGLLFLLVTQGAQKLVLRVKIEAPTVYTAQVNAALQENGVTLFSPYRKGREDLICSRLLSLDGVSYCSIEKRGGVLTVTLKTNAFERLSEEKTFLAERAGTLRRLVVLRGTPLKKEGEQVTVGETLVEDALYTEEGERTKVKAVAYAEIACVYEGRVEAKEEKQAFATAYLEAGLQAEQARIEEIKTEKQGRGYTVRIAYVWRQALRI